MPPSPPITEIDSATTATAARYRCPRCHDPGPVPMRCDRCRIDMVADDSSIANSVHGETRSILRPSGVRSLIALTAATSVGAGILAAAVSELWVVMAVFALTCVLSLALAAVIAGVSRRVGFAKVTRWPARAVPRSIADAKEGEMTCVRGRVVAIVGDGAPIHFEGVPCVAVSTAVGGGMTTRAARRFLVEDANGLRAVVDASELLVCKRTAHAAIPIGAEVEVAGVAHWTVDAVETATFRSGPGLVLMGGGSDPVRIRVCGSASAKDATRVRVASDIGADANREVTEGERARDDERESSAGEERDESRQTLHRG